MTATSKGMMTNMNIRIKNKYDILLHWHCWSREKAWCTPGCLSALFSYHINWCNDGDEAYDHVDDEAVDGGDGEPHYFKQCWWWSALAIQHIFNQGFHDETSPKLKPDWSCHWMRGSVLLPEAAAWSWKGRENMIFPEKVINTETQPLVRF